MVNVVCTCIVLRHTLAGYFPQHHQTLDELQPHMEMKFDSEALTQTETPRLVVNMNGQTTIIVSSFTFES